MTKDTSFLGVETKIGRNMLRGRQGRLLYANGSGVTEFICTSIPKVFERLSSDTINRRITFGRRGVDKNP